jgi:hypothetical protein
MISHPRAQISRRIQQLADQLVKNTTVAQKQALRRTLSLLSLVRPLRSA